MLRLQRSCVSDTCIFELCWCRICLLTATELGVWFYIANGGFDHCLPWKLIQIVKKNCSFCIYILTANPLLALKILTPNHFLFYEPALSRCQINGTEMLRVNLSACFELKTRTVSTTAIKLNTSWDGLLRFEAISQDQRVAKTSSFNKKWCCLLSKFVKWLSKLVDLSLESEKTKKTWTMASICTLLYFRYCLLDYPVNILVTTI